MMVIRTEGVERRGEQTYYSRQMSHWNRTTSDRLDLLVDCMLATSAKIFPKSKLPPPSELEAGFQPTQTLRDCVLGASTRTRIQDLPDEREP